MLHHLQTADAGSKTIHFILPKRKANFSVGAMLNQSCEYISSCCLYLDEIFEYQVVEQPIFFSATFLRRENREKLSS